MKNHDRYLAIVQWAKVRYQNRDGSITVSVGGRPTKYARIEDAAWRKYINTVVRDESGILIFKP